MIIESIENIRDSILQYQPYFNKGFADAKILQYADRPGIFIEHSKGEQEYVMELDYNCFYIRRTSALKMQFTTDNSYRFEMQLKLVAFASNVDQYKFASCLLSVLLQPCGVASVTNLETNNERILITEAGNNKDVLKSILSRVKDQQFVSIDFSIFEDFNPVRVTKAGCFCDPCKTCAE